MTTEKIDIETEMTEIVVIINMTNMTNMTEMIEMITKKEKEGIMTKEEEEDTGIKMMMRRLNMKAIWMRMILKMRRI